MSRIRLFDKDWNCVYDNTLSTQPTEEFMRDYDWLNCTEDHPNGQRWTGRVVNTDGVIEKHRADEYLEKLLTAPNPLLEQQKDLWKLPDDPLDPAGWLPPSTVDAVRRTVALQMQVKNRESWERLERLLMDGIRPQLQALADAVKAARPSLEKLAQALDDDTPPPPRADGRPHPPRPARKPPMWANDPTKSRRRR